MRSSFKLSAAVALALLAAVVSTPAQTVVYDNLTTAATAGYSEPNLNNPIFGDSLTLAQGGTASIFGFTLFNSSSGGNTGSILSGTMLVKFYDNTLPYAGGVLSNPLLGSTTVSLNFSGSPLPAGYYTTASVDLTSLGIVVPQNILVTQQFTQTAGTSTRNGFVLMSDPVVGSSPNTVYIKSTATAEGLYTFSGNPGQVGYSLEVVPEPATLTLAGLALAATALLRRRT